MSQYCVICYNYPGTMKKLRCQMEICQNCVAEWVHSKLIMDRLKDEVLIPCPNSQCKDKLTVEEIIDFVGPKKFEKINDMFTSIYTTSTEDMRACPNDKCGYAGFIALETCSAPLECPECGYTWREYLQMSQFEKMKKSVADMIDFNSETFSYLNKVLTGCPCPRCGITIWKDGGCNHMNCYKCGFEFCWFCLGHYPGYRHTEWTFCPLRTAITYMLALISLFSVEMKMAYMFPWVAYFNKFICLFAFYFVLGIIIPNLYAYAALIEIGCVCLVAECWKNLPKKRYFLGLLVSIALSIAYPILYFYVWYLVYQSDYWCFMFKFMMIEIILIVGFYAVILLCVLLSNIFWTIWEFTRDLCRNTYRECKRIIVSAINFVISLFVRFRRIFYYTKQERARDSAVKRIKANKSSNELKRWTSRKAKIH